MSETEYRSELEKLYPLDETGTRFQHYSELRELFADGIEILTKCLPAHRSPGDDEKLKKLKAAEELIAKRLELLSGFERQTVWNAKLPSTLRAIEVERQNRKSQLLLKAKPDDEPTSTAKDKATSTDIT